jgi:hypothetical protein
MHPAIRNSPPYRLLNLLRDYVRWSGRGFAAPSPHLIKQACLVRNGIPGGTWIETGTFLGETTEFLAKRAQHVYSIEPEPGLFKRAHRHFGNRRNVEIMNGTSEEIFPGLLPKINGDVNFWLDGHYSAGITFQGPQDTPIIDELKCIAANLGHFGKVCVLVDDIRCFNPRVEAYASKSSCFPRNLQKSSVKRFAARSPAHPPGPPRARRRSSCPKPGPVAAKRAARPRSRSGRGRPRGA